MLRSSSHENGVSSSRDAGLQMTLVAPFPSSLLTVHSVCGALLLLSALLQKHLVVRMSRGEKVALWHHVNGFACLALMLVMAGAGFLMAPYSSWDNFQSFSIGFAAPWFVWAVAICE